MITKTQIFIIYEQGIYGTFFANLFARHKLLSKEYIIGEFISDKHNYNAHRTGYKNRLKKFHTDEDINNLLKKNEGDLKVFFTNLNNHELSIHRLASYFSLKIDFKKFFSNYVRIILIPKKTRLKNYAERMFFTLEKTYKSEYWAKNFKKKKLKEVPEYFLRGMSIKEKEKYLNTHLDFFYQHYKNTESNDIIFDPDDIVDQHKLKEVVDRACKILNIEPIELPNDEIKKFINNNKQFLQP